MVAMNPILKKHRVILLGLSSINLLLLLAAWLLSVFFQNIPLILTLLVMLSVSSSFLTVTLFSHRIRQSNEVLCNSIEQIAVQDGNLLGQSANLLDPAIIRSLNCLSEKVITQKRHLNEKYLEVESLIDAMADGLMTIAEDGTILSANLALQTLLGYSADELLELHISKIAIDPKSVSAQSYLNSFICKDEDKHKNLEVQVKRKDGEIYPVRFSVSTLKVSTQLCYIAILSDISDIKEMERQLTCVNLELSKSNERLEKTSITDGLTQLFNRRHFDTMIIKELQRCTRQRTSLSLLIIDIDFFKQFNDIYGHATGDEGIKKVARCIKQVFKRSGDLPARYGGEEFAIILPGCDGLELQERAETLRQEIYNLGIPHTASRADECLTVSIGAVTYKPQSMEVVAPKPKELFSEADKALYRAKANGRNQVIFGGQYQPVQMPTATSPMYGQLFSR